MINQMKTNKQDVNILIVDDHFIFRIGLLKLIETFPFVGNVHQCANGEEALLILKNESYHILLMDIRMPVLNGIETTKIIRLDNKAIKIIAISMLDDRTSITQMMVSGANGYLTKNTSSSELLEAIKTVLSTGFYISKELPNLLEEELRHGTINPFASVKWKLSKREQDILKLICQGFTNKEASLILNVSIKNIEAYKTKLMEKSGAKNSTALVRFALEHKLLA